MAPYIHKNKARTFDFARQFIVELLVTSALLKAWQHALPAGYTLRKVSKEEQHRGDLCLEGVGQQQLYIELKTEAYPVSLFIEPIQFWRDPSNNMSYRRSWGFTTSAQLMLYLSGKTGQVLLCPRESWLSSGMKLFEAHLLATRADEVAYRPYVTVNSRAGSNGVRDFSGGAAGTAMETTSWLRAYQALGHDCGLIQMANGSELLDSAKQTALAITADEIRDLLKSHKRSFDDATVTGVQDELQMWAEAPQVEEAFEDKRRLDALLSTYREVKGLPPDAELPHASSLADYFTQPRLTELSNAPLSDPMWFLASACLQCSWTRVANANKDRLIAQATQTPMRLDIRGLPGTAGMPEKMKLMAMRFGADLERQAPRPRWEKLQNYVLEPDTQKIRQWQIEYFKAHRHPPKRLAA